MRCHINLPMSCNMRPPCPGCGTLRDRISKGTRWLSYDEGAEWFSAIRDLTESVGPLEITALWGEPFADPIFTSFLSRQSWIGNTVEIISNMIDVEQLYKFDEMPTIIGSWHPHHWSLEDFMGQVGHARNIGATVSQIFLLAYPEQFEEIVVARDELLEMGESPAIMPFGGIVGGVDYPSGYQSDMWSVICEDLDRVWGGHELIVSTEGHEGRPCRVGHDYFCISSDGTVSACYMGGPRLGNVFDRDVVLEPGPICCPFDRCPCPDMWVYHVVR